jgi:hypothetical protein
VQALLLFSLGAKGKGKGWGKGGILGDIDDSGNMPLHWGAGQEEVDLIVRVAKATEVFDATCNISDKRIYKQ